MFCFCPSGKCQADDKFLEVTYFLHHDPPMLPPPHTLFPWLESVRALQCFLCPSLPGLVYTDLIWNVRTDRSRSQTKLPTHLFFLLTFQLQQSLFKRNEQRIVSEHECRLVCLPVLMHVCVIRVKAERDDKTQQVYPFQLVDFSPLKRFKTLNVFPLSKSMRLIKTWLSETALARH